ncbi:YycH family regulatory protein [Paenibacillus chartarius]|uniref:YycH family regulatory protein n=1 Tax=Paenibacillus chartarius TaxID=747481 RepID=A0ABV6DE97_9BACL
MIEKVKSFLLVALVVTSLLQTYLLTFSNPQFEPFTQNEYVQAEKPLGTKLELEELLFPDQVVLHFGAAHHSVLYPGDLFYPTILEKVKQRYFEGFRKINPFAAGVDWDDPKGKQQGLEIRFGHGVPFSVLKDVLQFKGELPSDTDVITRIWITISESKESVRTYFLTDNLNTMYEVMKADFTAKDLDEYLAQVDYPQYHLVPGSDFYLPNQDVSVNAYTFSFTELTPEQLKMSLFVDPGVTRNLREKDGSVIYTDAKRGLQLSPDLHWMSYTDPVAPADTATNVRDDLLSAIQFVNQHGGWNGKFMLANTSNRSLDGAGVTFSFRQYLDRHPIVGTRPESIGSMQLTTQKGTVSKYERSTMSLDQSLGSRVVTLDGGEKLDNRWKAYPKRSSILSMYPAYRPVVQVQEQRIELRPVWAVELRDGTIEYLP